MSDYSSQSFIDACFERLRTVDPSIEASVIPRLRTMLAPALESLAQKVAMVPELKHLLRKSLGTITTVSSVGNFATLQAGAQPILLDQIRTADIRALDGRKIQILTDKAGFDQDHPDSFYFGARDGVVFYTDAPDGALPVTANYIETDVANLPTQLVPMLFDEMLALWARKAAA